MKRNAMIARIHIAKSRALTCPECGILQFSALFQDGCPGCGRTDLLPLSDERYRRILMGAGGAPSCRDISDAGLVRVMDVFDTAGFSKEHPYVSPKAEQVRQRQSVVRRIKYRAPRVLGDNWEIRIRGFIRKNFDKESLEFLTADELRMVIGWINRTDKYQKRSKIHE